MAEIIQFRKLAKREIKPENSQHVIYACWRAMKGEKGRKEILKAALSIVKRIRTSSGKRPLADSEKEENFILLVRIRSLLRRAWRGEIKEPNDFLVLLSNIAYADSTQKKLPAPK